MKFTLSAKGLVLLAVPLLFQLAFAGLVFRTQRVTTDAQRLASNTKDVISQAQKVQTDLSDAQTGTRGYVITRDPNFALPFERAARDLPENLARLAELARDNPDQTARVEVIARKGSVFLAYLADVVELVWAGAADRATERVRGGEGKRLMDELRAEIGIFLTEEDRLDRERTTAVERSQHVLAIVLVGGGLGAVLTTGLLAYFFHRGVSRRFAALMENTTRLATNQELAPPLTGGDEMAELDRAFRKMAAELTRTADRLREAAREVQDLYDNAPCGYHSVGPDGTVVMMNRTELRWLALAAEDVLGRVPFADLVSPRSRQTYQAGFARVREHGSVSDVELELVRADGSTFPVLLNSTSVRDSDGRYLRSRSTLVDLTERKRSEDAVRRLNAELEGRVRERTAELAAVNEGLRREVDERTRTEAALRLSERRYRSFVTASAQVVWITNPAGELDGHSAEWQAYTGQTTAEARGLGWMAAVRPEDRGRVGEAWRRAITTLTPYEVEYFLQIHDGSWRHVQARGVPVLEPDGSLREWVGTCIDVTDRRTAEEALRRRSDELAEANRDLAQKNAENEMFVYSVSHDLRSPLVNLQGFSKELEKAAQALARHLTDAAVPPAVRGATTAILDGKVAKSVGFIQTAVMRLSGIIDALLRLSRAGRVEYRWEVVDLGRVVGRVVEALNGTIAERQARITVRELLPVLGDATALEQLFANLIGNAVNYLDLNRPGQVEVGCLPDSNSVRTYYVRDNGLGIAEGHRGKIFQPFQRAHPGVGKGEGLGLAIVARVVERHRGKVWVESRVGEGSTFFIALPADPEGGAR